MATLGDFGTGPADVPRVIGGAAAATAGAAGGAGAGAAAAGGRDVEERLPAAAAGFAGPLPAACTPFNMRITCCRCVSIWGEGTPIGATRRSWQNCTHLMASTGDAP
jgi:hypothetical protein